MLKSRELLLAFMFLVLSWSTIIGSTPVSAADTLVDEVVTVDAGTVRYYSFNANYDNLKLFITIEVLSGNDISVHVTDETNFEKWMDGDSVPAYLSKQKMGSFSADITLGSAGTYYVILDNSYSIVTGKSVHVIIEGEVPTNPTLLLLGLFVVMGGGGVIAVILIVRRRSITRVVSPPPMVPSPPLSAVPPVIQSSYGFCPSCGSPIDHSGNFCMKCGQKIPSKDH